MAIGYLPVDVVAVDEASPAARRTAAAVITEPPRAQEAVLSSALQARAMVIVGCLLAINVACLLGLFSLARHYPDLTSPGLLAYTFGIRHAVDAGEGAG